MATKKVINHEAGVKALLDRSKQMLADVQKKLTSERDPAKKSKISAAIKELQEHIKVWRCSIFHCNESTPCTLP